MQMALSVCLFVCQTKLYYPLIFLSCNSMFLTQFHDKHDQFCQNKACDSYWNLVFSTTQSWSCKYKIPIRVAWLILARSCKHDPIQVHIVRIWTNESLCYIAKMYILCGAELWIHPIPETMTPIYEYWHVFMGTIHMEKKTTHGYIIGVWKIYWTHCILEFAQIPSKLC